MKGKIDRQAYTEETVTHEEFKDERIRYKDSSFEIESIIACLIGIPKRVFENELGPPKLEIYKRFDKDKNTRIIRHICINRTSIERVLGHISDKMKYHYRSILSMHERIFQEPINQLF